MRDSDRDLFRLRHILESINNVNKFMEGKTIDSLRDEPMLYYAVIKNMEIIGEAAYKLTHEFKLNHPETPWKIIIKMRHILVHGYYQVDAEELFNVYTEDLPILRPQILSYINLWNDDELVGS